MIRQLTEKECDAIVEQVFKPLADEPPVAGSAIGSEMLLWRAGWGRISAKPVKCIELGGGYIKVVGSCTIKQKRDDRHESYHDSYKEALMRLLTNAAREMKDAEKELASAKRRLGKAKAKWCNYVASPNSV